MDNEYSIQEQIGLLTDVHSENCKNYFQNVFVAEITEKDVEVFRLEVGERTMEKNKEKFSTDYDRSKSFPIIYPNGGNPLHAQGIYPIPCYLLYDPHIKAFSDPQIFIKDFLLSRIHTTVSYQQDSDEHKKMLAERIANKISEQSEQYVKEDKQLGILMIVDHRLSVYESSEKHLDDPDKLWISKSRLYRDRHVHLDGHQAVQAIIEAKFIEASSLGVLNNAVSTFTNKREEKVVSIYNKSWLWLSPTWDSPKSVYWKDDEWTNGIKVDRDSYAAFLYGTQFLKNITRRISSRVLKEMFAPVENVEAKEHRKATSIDEIYGAPIILPLLNNSYELSSVAIQNLLENTKEHCESALHLDIIAGINQQIDLADKANADQSRLTLLYYSGDLSRGNMHIRAVIEDVIPSVAKEIEDIIDNLVNTQLYDIQQLFGLKKSEFHRIQTLPSLLANAYGPGYIWSALQKTLHREDLNMSRLTKFTARKLNELANKRSYWLIKQELTFYFSYMYFLQEYRLNIQNKEKGVKALSEWKELTRMYHEGAIREDIIQSPDSLGFVTGLFLRQFGNSYHYKTGKDFVEHRVMKFGSKLTPEMIWINGVERAPDLAMQWKLKLGGNFFEVLPLIMEGFVKQKALLVADQDVIITSFWAGYYSYKNPKNEINTYKEEVQHVNP